MYGLWMSGFVLGMAHAFDPDHIAAIGPLSGPGPRRRGLTLMRGFSWGLGHLSALFVVCALAISLKASIDGTLEAGLEAAVGLMLIFLGCRAFMKLGPPRSGLRPSALPGAHRLSHGPARLFSWPTYSVGLVHGMAGSAALLVLVSVRSDTASAALANVVIFGLGAAIGMALLSWLLGKPIGWLYRNTIGGEYWSRAVIAAFAIVVGLGVIASTIAPLWAWSGPL